MNKKEKLAFALVGALAMTTSGLAFAVSSVPSTQVIYGCVATSSGVVGSLSSKKPKCSKGTYLLTLNVQGPKGDKGLQGLKGGQGLQGLQGLKGDQGLQGVKGDQGLAGESGSKWYVENQLTKQKHEVFILPGIRERRFNETNADIPSTAIEIEGVLWSYPYLVEIVRLGADSPIKYFDEGGCSGTTFVNGQPLGVLTVENTTYSDTDRSFFTLKQNSGSWNQVKSATDAIRSGNCWELPNFSTYEGFLATIDSEIIPSKIKDDLRLVQNSGRWHEQKLLELVIREQPNIELRDGNWTLKRGSV